MLLRRAPFGEALVTARQMVNPTSVGEDGAAIALRRPEPLMNLEFSFDPALQRTLTAASVLAVTGQKLDENTAGPWLQWAGAGVRAMSRIAAKCWQGIPNFARAVLLDRDDLPLVVANTYLYQLRQDSPGPALRFAGMDRTDVAEALRSVWTLTRATPAFNAAQHAASSLPAKEMLHLQGIRDGVIRRLEPEQGETLGAFSTRARREVSEAYEPLDPEVAVHINALRHFNGLVHRIIWSLTGLAESLFEPEVRDCVAPLRLEGDQEVPRIALTTDDDKLGLLRPTNPVRLRMNLPTDGLTLVVGMTDSFARASSLIDLRLEPLQWYMQQLSVGLNARQDA